MQCNDCKVPFEEEAEAGKVSKWLASEKDLQLEVYIVWQRGFMRDGRLEDIYDDWLRKRPKVQMEEECKVVDGEADAHTAEMSVVPYTGPKQSDSPAISLYECLKFSSKPEQLEQDNMWYCNKCKDHVQAFKTMEIYKTPNVLIIHLKRFKNSNKYFKSKLETPIDFPLDGLLLNDNVLNHHLPQDVDDIGPSNTYTIIYRG